MPLPYLRSSLTALVAALVLGSACSGGTDNTGTAGSSAGGRGGGAAGASAGGSGGSGPAGSGGAIGQAGAGSAGSGAAGTGGTTGLAGNGGAGPAGGGGSSGSSGSAGSGGSGAAGRGGAAGGTAGTGPAGAGGRGGAAGSAGGTGGSPTGCPVGAVFCDDFEAGTLGQPPNAARWMLSRVGGNGVIQIDSAQFHGGSKSLHIDGTNQFHTMAMVTGAPVFPLPTGVLYGRAWLRLASVPGPNTHVSWIEAGSAMNDQAETRIGYNLGQMDINRWPGDTEQRAPSATLQAGMWYCVEFMFDSTADEARVWLGGSELTDLHVTNWVAPNPQNGNNTNAIPNWAPDYQAVRFGWELQGASIWFDDIALGYSRINCQ